MASSGIVSAITSPLRPGRGRTAERYIHTDATPYPGFSGGAVIDTSGAVLGIMTTGLVTGLTLAVPVEAALSVGDTLAAHGVVKRGFLGIASQQAELPEAVRLSREQDTGLLVVRVETGSPAERGGLRAGDIVVALDGEGVPDAEALLGLLTGERVDKSVSVELLRGGEAKMLQIQVGKKE